ncbi:MAG: hypothetical protein GY950_17510, partial [bacterium]|nr:hypothetical protein [bacterium]
QHPLHHGSGDVSKGSREPASLGQGGFGRIDEHSGTYAYSIPVHIPPSQNGAPLPQVSLVYNSKNNSAPGLVGAGWRLELGKISRVGIRSGSVDFKNNQGADDANDHFVLQLNGSSYTLVGVYEQTGSFRIKIEKSCAVVKRFLSKTETDPMSGEKVIDYWEVYLADGTKYRFGTPEKPGRDEGELLNKTWNLMEIENPYGQKAIYKYEPYHNAQNPAYKELDFFYPAKIQCGVTPDGFWDGEIEFEYTDKDVPDDEEGYSNLGSQYTGRRPFTCIIWRRLTKIRTLFRNEQGKFQLSRELVIDAVYKSKENVFWVKGVEEIAYKNGKIDKSAELPPHRFEYIFKGRQNPALMNKSTDPLGKVEEARYALAAQIDSEAQNMGGIYLVTTFTEKAGTESWTKTYQYLGGLFYRAFDEYRGHRWVKTIDNETNFRIETRYEQNGVHNGYVKEQKSFDAEGKFMSHTLKEWMALDYRGGRYMPFVRKEITRQYAEDGVTVLSTQVKEIPRRKSKETPWGHAVDQFGNALEQLETVYDGHEDNGSVVYRKRCESVYKNVIRDAYRLIGLPVKRKVFACEDLSMKWRLIEWVENTYNDKGKITGTFTRFDSSDLEGKIYRDTFHYHPLTGKITKTYRYNQSERILDVEKKYHEEGPYRFLPMEEINAEGHVEVTVRFDLQTRLATRIIRPNGLVVEKAYDGLGRVTEEIYKGDKDSSAKQGLEDSVRYIYTITPGERCIETIHIHTGFRMKEYYDSLNRKYRVITTGFKGREILSEDIRFDHRTRKPARMAEPRYLDEAVPVYRFMEYDDSRLRPSREI